MKRDISARTRIREYLATHGGIADPTGYATRELKDAVGYSGNAVAFIQLIAAMDQDGEITREVRGKRTYRIALGHVSPPGTAPAGAAESAGGAGIPFELDYDRLARAMVREFLVQLGGPGTTLSGGTAFNGGTALNGGGAQEAERLRAERNEYALRLEIARLKLASLLGDRAGDLSSEGFSLGDEQSPVR
jgi:hypothetical protein